MKIFPIILSGGSGKRLWPLSRGQFPKQYQTLFGENSMLQQTILRLNGLKNISKPIIVCNSSHRFIVAEQLQQINIDKPTILLEPIGRNTAPAIAAAAVHIMKDKANKDAVLLILSADHAIQDTKAFHESINIAKDHLMGQMIATFGITPDHPNTEYGYIQVGTNTSKDKVMHVKSFKEKPNIDLANEYLKQNTKKLSKNLPINWYWNSGMFMCHAHSIIDGLSLFSVNIINNVKESVEKASNDFDFIRLEEKSFASCPSISIDFALMEQSKNVIVVPLAAKWSDVGSWSALYEIGDKDENNNVIKGDVLSKLTTNSYINSSVRLVVTTGVDNLIVVDTQDAVLIANRSNLDQVKTLVDELSIKKRAEAHSNRKVFRPWGWFDSIETGKNFQVKRLHVNPSAKLSLQKHFKRAEHWIVVSGLATVIRDNEVFILKEGQSTYIDIGQIHSLENKTEEMLEVIEVQNGSYLGEDDILRFEDEYGRD